MMSSQTACWAYLEQNSDRVEIQREIRAAIRQGKFRVVPASRGKIRIIVPEPAASTAELRENAPQAATAIRGKSAARQAS